MHVSYLQKNQFLEHRITMKVLSQLFTIFWTFATLIFGHSGADLPSFKVQWVKKSIPSVKVTFPNGNSDRLILDQHYSHEPHRRALEREFHCNFIGRLEKEGACVAMTGCPGEHDIEFTIHSKHLIGRSNMFKWHLDGTIEALDTPDFGRETEYEFDDEEADDTFKPPPPGLRSDEDLPASMHIGFYVAYENYYKQVAEGREEFLIAGVMTHTQSYFCLASLTTQIQFEIVGPIRHIDQNWHAGRDPEGDSYVRKIVRWREANPDFVKKGDLLAVFAGDPEKENPQSGTAISKTVCRRHHKMTSVTEYKKSIAFTAGVFTHELGHNIGMKHDFDPEYHPPPDHNCTSPDVDGFMDYGNHRYEWSPCSVSDLRNHYNYIIDRYGSWCTEEIEFENFCDHNECRQDWIGDGLCDDQNNIVNCQFDGGDCCGREGNGWNLYCKDCFCLDFSEEDD